MSEKRALIVVDVQNDFLPGGALAVPGGDRVIAPVARLMTKDIWETVVVTQDWHPADHVSFAANHPGKHPFETTQLPYGTQVLWPVHCVGGTRGAEVDGGIPLTHADLILRKGTDRTVDSYSAFCAGDRQSLTGLEGYLKGLGIREVWICGLATDFCVNYSAQDAAAAGFKTFVITDASAAISSGWETGEGAAVWAAAGITPVTEADCPV